MTVSVITPPAALVTLALAKQHLRVDGVAEDALITAYIAAACGHLDGPGAYLGRSVGVQVLEKVGRDFPACPSDALPYGPVTGVVSVKYLDALGVEQTFPGEAYSVVDGYLVAAGSFPTTGRQANAVRVRYNAGAATAPPAIVAAVLLMVGDLYQNREFVPTVSNTVENLLRPYRLLEV